MNNLTVRRADSIDELPDSFLDCHIERHQFEVDKHERRGLVDHEQYVCGRCGTRRVGQFVRGRSVTGWDYEWPEYYLLWDDPGLAAKRELRILRRRGEVSRVRPNQLRAVAQ